MAQISHHSKQVDNPVSYAGNVTDRKNNICTIHIRDVQIQISK
jgi:hypothetical protein